MTFRRKCAAPNAQILPKSAVSLFAWLDLETARELRAIASAAIVKMSSLLDEISGLKTGPWRIFRGSQVNPGLGTGTTSTSRSSKQAAQASPIPPHLDRTKRLLVGSPPHDHGGTRSERRSHNPLLHQLLHGRPEEICAGDRGAESEESGVGRFFPGVDLIRFKKPSARRT